MSKVIDPKSFIIGVLSAIVVCMAMGADRLVTEESLKENREFVKRFNKEHYTSQTFDNWDTEQFWDIKKTFTTGDLPGDQFSIKGWQPFAVTKHADDNFLYHYRRPRVNRVKD